ncbi:tetraacyldisaccharide 4'-kinase [Spirosoma pomorum]
MTSWLLLPFSALYGCILAIRNWLYDNNLFKSVQPKTYTLCVGNLTVGGTGKTPMIEFLIEWQRANSGLTAPPNGHVHTQYALATVSRGYGRQTRGFRLATPGDTAATIGDEPLQLYRKFSDFVRVCVSEKRVIAIQQLEERFPETQRILLDDAFQHRAVRAHLTIVLMDFNRPFYRDHPFPAGRLRERRVGARRADAIVVTKSPLTLSVAEQQRITEEINRYVRPNTPVFFAGLRYAQPVAFGDEVRNRPERVRLVTGLASAGPLEQHVREQFTLVEHRPFADHYAYTRADVLDLISGLQPDESILTTEKDWVKLAALLTPTEQKTLPFFYLPIAVQFLPGSAPAFDQFLQQHVGPLN